MIIWYRHKCHKCRTEIIRAKELPHPRWAFATNCQHCGHQIAYGEKNIIEKPNLIEVKDLGL